MKTLRFSLLSVLLLMCNMMYAYEFEHNGIYYERNWNGDYENEVFVTQGDQPYEGYLTIPTTVIAPYWGEYKVVGIGNSAFSNCEGLMSISLPSSITTIGEHAFSDCYGLTSINLPSSITTIGEYAFYNCSGLTSIILPSSLTTIGEYAFSNCEGLTSIILPSSLTTIGEHAFYNCGGLTSIYIPASVTSIGNNAFYGCTGLTNINLPSSITTIGEYAFSYCYGLTSIYIPASVTSIGNNAFYGCTELTSIDLPESLTTIGESAFFDCCGLTSINIPESVTTIGESAFSGCRELTSIIVDNGNSKYVSRNNCNAIIETASNTLVAGCKNTTIPASITTIGESAFYNCSGLTSINIPESVTTIGNNAFYYCYGLTSINLPSSITTIGESAFSGCSRLTSINIPESVTTIGEYTFYGCGGLTSIDIPASVTSIGERAFSSCNELTSITVDNGNSKYDSRNNCNAIIETASNTLVVGCKNTTIPASITAIGNCAFYDCSGLTSINIPESVTTIGNNAFYYCYGLTSINLPSSITTIGNNAFSYCNNLPSINLPKSLTTIGNSAFYGCYNLRTIINNSNLTLTIGSSDYGYIAHYAYRIFLGEQINGDFYFDGTDGAYVLTGYVGNATNLQLPDNYKGQGYEIGSYAFYDCDGLTSVTIPNGVTDIGENAFYECSALKNIEIPESVTSIGENAFKGCSFDYIHFLNTTPVTYTNFLGTQDRIFVPGASLDTYRNAEGWKQWAHIITTKERVIQDITITALSSGSGVRKAIGKDDIVNEVYSLTIKGTINSYDIIVFNQKMPNLTYLDLSEAQIVACDYPYSGSTCTADNTLSSSLFYKHASLRGIKLPKEMHGAMGESVFYQCPKLREVVLPAGITSIGGNAFENCDELTSVTIPNSVTNIGDRAFYDCDKLTSVTLGNSVTSIGSSAFCGCHKLTSITLGNSVTSIGGNAFFNCYALTSIEIPNSVTSIGDGAFRNCSNLQSIKIPASVTSINANTFYGCSKLTSVTLPPRLTTIGDMAFYDTELTEIRLPSSLRSISRTALSYCPLKKVYTYTILPLSISNETFGNAANAELYLPETSSDYYYFASGWNEFLVHKTFNEPYEYFYLNGDFTVDDNTGFVEGEDGEHPDADINIGGGLVVEGEQSDSETPNQSLGDVNLENDGNGNSGSIIGDNNLTVDNLNIKINVTSGKWYFFAFPFDIMLEDISLSNGGSYVWRYYDGAERANGKTGWKTVNGNKLNAAQGYIFQCSKSGVLTLNIENVRFKKEDKYLELLAHVSANLKDASWNFMGNPYLSYYDMSDMDYTAPVTVWDGSKYVAMRPGDDEYHFAPFQTFFVQKSEGTASVGFQGDKQMTQKQSQNKKAQAAAAPKMQVMSENEEQPARQLINLVLTSGEQTDGTRIVFNEAQSRAYEAACDAAKFETQGVIQLFTIGDQKERYAINERPADNGIVALGFSTPTAGDFTISAARMDTPVYLKDRETGSVYDLRQGAYQFSAGAGTHANRFEVLLEATVTGIQEVGTATEGDATKVYDLGGRRVKENGKGVYIINGEKTLVK